MNNVIYMDYNATAPIRESAVAAWTSAAKSVGNASSVHASGREASRVIEEARTKIAALTGARNRDVVFTSGGTEANNAVLRGAGAKHIIHTSVEHDSVLAAAAESGVTVDTIPVDQFGTLDLSRLDEALKASGESTLVSVMLVNNETGIIQDMAPISTLAKEYGARLHVDAIQAAGKIEINISTLGADYISLSAHKIGGPQGVGAIVLAPTAPLAAFVTGGGQELGRRSGTENVAGIAGFGSAALDAMAEVMNADKTKALRDRLEAEITTSCPNVTVIKSDNRVANTSCLALNGVVGETQVMHFDLAGIAVSSGSACSSGKVKTSHVLTAMGYAKDIAKASIRVSLGWNTTDAEVDAFVKAYNALYERTTARRG